MLGLPGSGKTTAAQHIAQQTGVVKLTADAIRIAIIPEPRWNMAEHRFFFGLLDRLTNQLLRSGRSVLLDANHNQFSVRQRKYQQAVQHAAIPAVIYVSAPHEVWLARNQARTATGGTEVIPASKLTDSPMAIAERMARNFEKPQPHEPVVAIDGTASPAEQIAAITAYLDGQGVKLPAKPTRSANLYLMLGLPGSGKTTAATEIARQTGAIHLSSDAWRLALFPKPTFSEAEHEQLYRILDYFTELLLVQGVDVIYDANLNRLKHRQEKYAISQSLNVTTRLLWVQTDHELAMARRVNDSHDGLRPPYESPAEMFQRIAGIFEAPDIDEPYMTLDGTAITADYIRHKLLLP